ncbi:MAG: hypothetical protein U0944_01705, partial [Candidatus Moranbacteria bacterium]|nr:hypothetical protein [Candidatus Moranbacteria bacterium]
MGRNKINLRMSDVRPANQDGGSPMGGIGRTSGSGPQSRGYRDGVVRRTSFGDIRRPGGAISRPAPVWQEKNGLLGYPVVSNDSVRIKIEKKIEPRFLADKAVKPNQTYTDYADEVEDMPAKRMVFSDAEDLKDIPSRRYKKIFFSFAGVAASIFLVIAGTGFFNKGMGVKNDVMGIGQDAYTDLAMARDGIAGRDFQKSSFEFGEAYDKFGEISQDINSLGGILVETSRFIPFFSKISSGDHIAQVGKDVSRIGILASGIMQSLDAIKNPLNGDADPSVSFLRIFQDTDNNLKEISILMQDV